MISLSQNAATIVAGVDWKDGIDFHAYLRGKDSAACDEIVKAIKAMLAQMRRDLGPALKDVSVMNEPQAAFHLKMYKDLFEHVRIRQCESTVRVHTIAKINLTDFAKYFFWESATPVKLK